MSVSPCFVLKRQGAAVSGVEGKEAKGMSSCQACQVQSASIGQHNKNMLLHNRTCC